MGVSYSKLSFESISHSNHGSWCYNFGMKKLLLILLLLFPVHSALATVVQEFFDLTNNDIKWSYTEKNVEYKKFVKKWKKKGSTFFSVAICIDTPTGQPVEVCSYYYAGTSQKEIDRLAIKDCEKEFGPSTTCLTAMRGFRPVWEQEKNKYFADLEKSKDQVSKKKGIKGFLFIDDEGDVGWKNFIYKKNEKDYLEFIEESKNKGYKYFSYAVCIETIDGEPCLGSFTAVDTSQKNSNQRALNDCKTNKTNPNALECVVVAEGKKIVYEQNVAKHLAKVDEEKNSYAQKEDENDKEEYKDLEEEISKIAGQKGFLVDLDYIDEDFKYHYFEETHKDWYIKYIKDGKKKGYKYFAVGRCVETTDGEFCEDDAINASISSQKSANSNTISYCLDLNKNAKVCLIAIEGTKIVWEKNLRKYLAKIEKKETDIIAKKEDEPEDQYIEQEKNNNELMIIGTGSGFFVEKNGYILTNHHVVDNCVDVVGDIKKKTIEGKVIATDKDNDLALVKFKYKNSDYILFNDPILGEDIIAVGYPLSDILGGSVKVTRGIVSSLLGDDNSIQIDAAIQPGNSGGPLLNVNGNAVGVVVSILVGEEFQNVNFGIKSSTVIYFLSSNNIKTGKKVKRIQKLSRREIVKIGAENTIQLMCLNTQAEYNRLLKQDRNVTNLLKKPLPDPR